MPAFERMCDVGLAVINGAGNLSEGDIDGMLTVLKNDGNRFDAVAVAITTYALCVLLRNQPILNYIANEIGSWEDVDDAQRNTAIETFVNTVEDPEASEGNLVTLMENLAFPDGVPGHIETFLNQSNQGEHIQAMQSLFFAVLNSPDPNDARTAFHALRLMCKQTGPDAVANSVFPAFQTAILQCHDLKSEVIQSIVRQFDRFVAELTAWTESPLAKQALSGDKTAQGNLALILKKLSEIISDLPPGSLGNEGMINSGMNALYGAVRDSTCLSPTLAEVGLNALKVSETLCATQLKLEPGESDSVSEAVAQYANGQGNYYSSARDDSMWRFLHGDKQRGYPPDPKLLWALAVTHLKYANPAILNDIQTTITGALQAPQGIIIGCAALATNVYNEKEKYEGECDSCLQISINTIANIQKVLAELWRAAGEKQKCLARRSDQARPKKWAIFEKPLQEEKALLGEVFATIQTLDAQLAGTAQVAPVVVSQKLIDAIATVSGTLSLSLVAEMQQKTDPAMLERLVRYGKLKETNAGAAYLGQTNAVTKRAINEADEEIPFVAVSIGNRNKLSSGIREFQILTTWQNVYGKLINEQPDGDMWQRIYGSLPTSPTGNSLINEQGRDANGRIALPIDGIGVFALSHLLPKLDLDNPGPYPIGSKYSVMLTEEARVILRALEINGENIRMRINANEPKALGMLGKAMQSKCVVNTLSNKEQEQKLINIAAARDVLSNHITEKWNEQVISLKAGKILWQQYGVMTSGRNEFGRKINSIQDDDFGVKVDDLHSKIQALNENSSPTEIIGVAGEMIDILQAVQGHANATQDEGLAQAIAAFAWDTVNLLQQQDISTVDLRLKLEDARILQPHDFGER